MCFNLYLWNIFAIDLLSVVLKFEHHHTFKKHTKNKRNTQSNSEEYLYPNNIALVKHDYIV